MKVEIVMEKQADGGYSAYVPKLPGCISQGETKGETLANIREAMELYLEDLTKEELQKLLQNIEIVKTAVKANA